MMGRKRMLEALILGSWCALFWFLMISGRTPLYLSSRTDWIVPAGALILTFATTGRLATARTSHQEEVGRSHLWGAAILILPVVVVMSLPPASLGSFAAARRTTLSAAGLSVGAEEIAEGELSLIDVASALRDEESMEALRGRAGEEVTFVGFVTRDRSDPADVFTLNRFIISCCVADALAVKVRVVGAPPGSVAEDDWARVTGNLFPLENEVAVDAREVEPIPRPRRPYLDP